jgi:hypothetical protein
VNSNPRSSRLRRKRRIAELLLQGCALLLEAFPVSSTCLDDSACTFEQLVSKELIYLALSEVV